MGKLVRWVVAAVVVLVVLVVAALLAIPAFLNTASFKAKIENTLTESLGRRVQIGNLSVSVFSGGLVADDVTIADDPQFSSQPFVRAQKVAISVEMMPLLLNKVLHVKGFTLDAPQIVLLSGPNNTWNYSSLGGAATKAKNPNAQENEIMPNLSVGELAVNDGRVSVGEIAAPGQPAVNSRVYDQVKLDAKDFGFLKSFPFSASAHLRGDGTVSANGQAGPVNEQNAASTPFAATVKLDHIDLATSGLLAQDAGIAGLAGLNAKLVSDGTTLSAEGSGKVDRLQVARNGAPSPLPVNLQFAVNQNMQAMTGVVRSATVEIGQAKVLLDGTYQTSNGPKGPTTALRMNANGQGMSIDQLTEFLPAVGVHLPSGSKLAGGTLSVKLDITGSTADPVIGGPVAIRGTQLAGFDLGKQLGPLAPIAGIKPGTPTRIQSLDATIHTEGGAVQANGISLVVAQLGSATGAIAVGASGSLNGRILAKLSSVDPNAIKNLGSLAGGSGATGQLVGLASSGLGGFLGGTGGGAAGNAANGAVSGVVTAIEKNGVPVQLGGTTSNPTFSPDLSGIKKGAAQGVVNSFLGGNKGGSKLPIPANNPLGNALGGLFGKH